LAQAMEGLPGFDVPFVVEMEAGPNWHDMAAIKEGGELPEDSNPLQFGVEGNTTNKNRAGNDDRINPR